ncbi:MAG: 1-(5-phosphoribosyl)-5-[(5-phosphoribosylamino)methylideneamino]imidazole-4-carboxamide isomerase [Proteobacteria bacterium]|nr:1-(5-phosphoribosyl)-5-[(5-phosphoribosylamino)methylideneamino]imidazole-4-carboxamide isomerase [Pseudomonadota bacterium]
MNSNTTSISAPAWALYPAIDICDGVCVRLTQGDFGRLSQYNPSPVDQALDFVRQGARCLHVVDLDGAREGTARNRGLITEIVRRCSDSFVQIGGGVRDEDTVAAYLDAGAGAVIIGTACLTQPDWVAGMAKRYPGRIRIGLDARGGRLASAGWLQSSELSAIEVARRFSFPDISAIIYTDIDKDGTLVGVNLAATVELAQAQPIPVIASGGVADLADVRAVHHSRHQNLAGVIIGRALYTGALELSDAVKNCGTDGPPQT